MPTPNLFILGPPRSGTTSIAKWLSEHPDVAIGPRKEPMFHAPDLPSPLGIGDRAAYERLWYGTEDATMRVDASPWYLMSKEAAPSIAGASPSAKLVVSLRDPVEVLASLHAHHVFRGFERIRELEEAVFAVRQPDAGEFRRTIDYLDTVRLPAQLDRFLEHFPSESLVYVDFSRMRSDPEGVYFDLLGDLGLRQVPLSRYPHLNRARHNRIPGMGDLLKGYPSKPARLVRKVAAKLGTAEGRPPIPPAVRRRILDVIGPDIEELAVMTGRDLSPWMASQPE